MKVSTATITRLIVLLLTLINTIFMILGKDAQIPFCEADIYEAVSVFALIAAPLWGYWKNNSWTQTAIEADEVLATMRKLDDMDKEAVDDEVLDVE